MPVGVFPMADSEIRAGLLFKADALSYVVSSGLTVTTDTGDGDPTYAHQANGFTLFAPDAIDLSIGVNLIAESSFDGTSGTWSVFYDGPCAPFGGWSAGGSGYRSGVSIEARLRTFRLYAMESGALLRIMFTQVELWVNGGLAVTLGPAVDATSAGVGPNYIPIVGIPLWVYRSCGAGRANTRTWTYDPCNPDNADGYDWETAVSQTVSGGWRWRETPTGAWIDAPVAPYAGSATRTYGDLLGGSSDSKYQFDYEGRSGWNTTYQFTCMTADDDTIVIGSGSAPATGPDPCTGAQGPAWIDVYKVHTENRSTGDGDVLLVPNLDKGLHRFAPGYAKLLRRLWFPETRAVDSTSDTVGGVTASTSSTTTVHPALGNDFLGLVRDADHAVFDFLDTPAYAPSSSGSNSTLSTSYITHGTPATLCPPAGVSTPSCPAGTGPLSVACGSDYVAPVGSSESHSHSVQFPTYVGPSGDYQGHQEPIARYLGTWPNPFWHLFDHRENWYLLGSNPPWASDPADDIVGYWGPVRDQWLYNAALPSGEKPKTRSAMIASPYFDWAYTPVFDEFTGGLPWTGVSRWQVREVAFPELLTLTSGSLPMLSCPDGSCTVAISGGNVVVTPTGSGPCVVDVDLVRADCFPYYGLLLAKKVKLGTYSNVDSVTASLRSSFGGSADLNAGAALASGAEYVFPRGTDSGYAGSWGFDEGVGVISDQGTDVAPGGDSAGHMADPETLAGFQGLRGLQGAVLRLTITPHAAGDVSIGLPTFRRFQGHPEVRWLDGNKAAMLWPDGPAILWGAHLTYVPDEGLHWPWLPKALGTPNSLADALQFAYAIFECTDPGDVSAFNAECNAWYDDFEVSLRNVGSADKFSFSFLLPKGTDETIRFAIVQTVAEVPPLACFPTGARSTGTWQAGTAPATERWDQSQERKYVVSPVAPLLLKNPDGALVSAMDTAPAGWSIQSYIQALTGDEADDWTLVQDETVAKVFPWRGWHWIGNFATLEAVHECADAIGRVFATLLNASRIAVRRFDTQSRDDTFTVSTGAYLNAQTAYGPQGHLACYYEDASHDAFVRRSYSSGDTWEAAVSVGSGLTNPAPAIDPQSGLEYCAFHNGTEWRLYSQDETGTMVDRAAITTEAAAKAGLVFRKSGLAELVFYVANRRFLSTDAGRHWNEI